jgi:FlaA1/EpsC-like NDP-sugar epimerase
MSRIITRSLQVTLDFVVLSVSFWLAFLFRFEFNIPLLWLKVAFAAWPFAIMVQYGVLSALGVPRFSWRYVSMRETFRISTAIAISTGLLVAVRLLAAGIEIFGFAVLPLGILATNFLLATLSLVAVRALRRVWGESQERKLRSGNGELARVLLIGAGQAGVMVAREIANRPDLGLLPVGFLDDDGHKVGTRIGGIAVLGKTSQIMQLAHHHRATRALITIANAPGAEIRRIALACKNAGLETKIIPGIYEIVGEQLNLSRIREVAIEDLLGRDPVKLDENQVLSSIKDSVVMVTGAGGSIGSELCRQVARFSPARLVLVERFENALFEIHRELIATFPKLVVEPRIADVSDVKRMDAVFSADRPSIIFHAAAHKHVPMMECNPGEAIKNNVGGTSVVADLAHRYGAERFVMISTDKAVNPTSVMGASKRVAEIYTQTLATHSKTRFVTVRFGNVLGSNGSVIPIFKEQIARGGPVMVTDPEMRRYFMTIPEASQLVLQAGAMGDGGEIFILDMGEPVKIVDLARDLIALSGFRPDDDIEIKFSGVRPGEKLFEELSTDSEHADKTKHPKIFIGRVRGLSTDVAKTKISNLLAMGDGCNGAEIRSALQDLVPEYSGAQQQTSDNDSPKTERTSERSERGDGSKADPPNGTASQEVHVVAAAANHRSSSSHPRLATVQ